MSVRTQQWGDRLPSFNGDGEDMATACTHKRTHNSPAIGKATRHRPIGSRRLRREKLSPEDPRESYPYAHQLLPVETCHLFGATV